MRTSLIILSLISSPCLESLDQSLEAFILDGDYEKALKTTPESLHGDDLFFWAVACEEAGLYEPSFKAYEKYLNHPESYAEEAKIRCYLLGKKLMISPLPEVNSELLKAMEETDPKKMIQLFQGLNSSLKTEIMIDRLIDLKEFSLSLKGPLTLTQEARLLYEWGKIENGPALLEKKKNLLDKLKRRGYPIDQYYISLLTGNKEDSKNLTPYLKSRLIVELESDPQKWKEAFEMSVNPYTLEKMALSFPALSIQKMNELSSLKNDYLMGLSYLSLNQEDKAEYYLKEALKGADYEKALFATIRLLEKKKDQEKAKQARLEYLKLKNTAHHAEVSFELYSYHDYIYGEKRALKHLNQFVKDFPQSPLVLNAYYLMGLDLKHPRKKSHPKNLTQAIDYFQEVETRFNEVAIPITQKEYYQALKQEAILERAKTLMLIAETSQDAKRKIYAAYAIDVLQQLLKEPLSLKGKSEAYLFWAKLLKMKGENPEPFLLSHLEEMDLENKARASLLLAEIALPKDPKKALDHLKETDILSIDEKLHGKILKSEAFEALGDLDQALLTLSEAVNENGVSQKRIEAMYKRACLYERQGREDLARRQLEAVKSKGGEWGEKASLAWKEKYGHLE